MELLFANGVRANAETVFAFFEHPLNLVKLLNFERRFRLLNHDGPVQVGNTVWFEFRFLVAIPVVLGFRHVIYRPPFHFRSELIHGPFDYFFHSYMFSTRACSTCVTEHLSFRLMAEFGGDLSTRLVVAPILRRLYASRQRLVTQLVAQMEEGSLAPSCSAISAEE